MDKSVKLIIEDVSISFNTVQVLKDINLTIHSGEIIIITGNSGQGKTTLLKILAGIENYEGHIYIDNTSDLDYLKLVAYVPQQNSLWENLTIFENLTLYRIEVLGESKEVAKKAFNELISLFDLTNLVNRFPAKLSGGEQQRVALARALATDRMFFLLDEITANLDEENKVIISSVLKKMQLNKKSFILVTHDLSFAKLLNEKYFQLLNGKLAPINL